ncbi:hypothetical protein [Bradyrhizobium zhanjiangense]|uniref:hypothetical protein n=1 Tax=Bradyrhizobium zhanjiangense TaxID=1325107 RepID=UPI001008BC10|nr:hypothetical protein [Bradyrhizobium zhanjiangense]
MKEIKIVFKTLGAAAILVGSFFGTLISLEYFAQQNDAKPTIQNSIASATLVVDPPSLRECDAPRIAKITWNVSSTGVQSVKIFVRDKKGREVLFTSGGSMGAANTAAWVLAGTTFVLKDGYTLNDITTISVKSDRC